MPPRKILGRAISSVPTSIRLGLYTLDYRNLLKHPYAIRPLTLALPPYPKAPDSYREINVHIQPQDGSAPRRSAVSSEGLSWAMID